ncbi:MAG: HRDC domain-containing protein [Oscillospiraceae bacterium]|nr:HRDC domain-containing protein [Oscillospiraceae bacterium]
MKKLTSPVVLKTGNSSQREINRLEQELSGMSFRQLKEKQEIEVKIRNFKYGLDGEKTVLFQLKNSYMPMYILHDLHLQFEDCKAQIDFLVVTRKLVLVLECKRLYGNIYINANGNFIRILNADNSQIEGMESPYTQNERHLKLIYAMCRAEQKNILQRMGFDRSFKKIYQSVIVLANPKTIINMEKAPETIRSIVKRSDELVAYIETLHKNSRVPEMSDEEMKEIAEFFLKRDTEKSQPVRKSQPEQPNVKKQREHSAPAPVKKTNPQKAPAKPEKSEKLSATSVEDSKVYGALRSYRYNQAQKENIKPYMICNNEQLVNLIQKNPRTLKELRTIPGFDSDEKCKKYGTEILRILAEHLPKPAVPEKPVKTSVPKKPLVKPGESVEDSKIYGALRSYRYNQAQKENIKPYMICNNDQLVKLIQANPGTIAELKKLDGFRDDQKCRKYGSAILKILRDFQ